MVSQRGFSLIELLVSLALLTFLVMLAVPFTNSWGNDAQLHETENLLRQGIGRAKAVALRNEHGVTRNQAAAKLCLEKDTEKNTQELKLYQAKTTDQPAKCSSSDDELVWSAKLSNQISIKADTTNFICLAITNRGLIRDPSVLVSPADSDNCSIKSKYTISIGADHVDVTLH